MHDVALSMKAFNSVGVMQHNHTQTKVHVVLFLSTADQVFYLH